MSMFWAQPIGKIVAEREQWAASCSHHIFLRTKKKQMHPFQGYVCQRMAEHLQALPPHTAHEICLFDCLIGFNEDDPRKGEVHLSYTTPTYWASKTPADSSDPERDKWYYVRMCPGEILSLCEGSDYEYGGDNPGDERGVALRDDYFASLGISLTDEEMEERYSPNLKRAAFTDAEEKRFQNLERRMDALPKAFIDVCALAVRHLFEDGVLVSVCGKPVPVIFELANDMGEEYLREQMRAVNPPGLTDEYDQWLRTRYS